jgi:hypothetical protein
MVLSPPELRPVEVEVFDISKDLSSTFFKVFDFDTLVLVAE